MTCAVKPEIPVLDRKESVYEVVDAHKRFLTERYSFDYLVKTIRSQIVNNFDGLRNPATLCSASMKINPFILLYEINFSSPAFPASSGYSILLPSILSTEELILTSIPLGITGKFFRSIYTNYQPGEQFRFDDIVSSVSRAAASAEAMKKLSLALRRLLYVYAILMEKAETEKP